MIVMLRQTPLSFGSGIKQDNYIFRRSAGSSVDNIGLRAEFLL